MKVPIPDSSNLKFLSEPKGIDKAHSIAGVPGSVSHAKLRSGYLQVENGKRIEPVWDIEVIKSNIFMNYYLT